MEKCENFRREITPSKQEIQFCMADGTDRHCAGFAEFCPVPEDFEPQPEKVIMQDEHGYVVEDFLEEDPNIMIWDEEDFEWSDKP